MRTRIFLFASALILILFLASGCTGYSKIKEFSPGEGCIKYFDGCNTCTLVDDSWACTEKACTVREEPKCLKYSIQQKYTPKENCIKYFDGCNSCFLENGAWACTEMGCMEYEEPRCTEINLTDCIIYNPDGCNRCTLEEDGQWMCTLKGCEDWEWKEPRCLAIDTSKCSKYLEFCNICDEYECTDMSCGDEGDVICLEYKE